MRCDKCQKNMVLRDENTINLSHPASRWWQCKCGHSIIERLGNEPFFLKYKSFEERWEEANK